MRNKTKRQRNNLSPRSSKFINMEEMYMFKKISSHLSIIFLFILTGIFTTQIYAQTCSPPPISGREVSYQSEDNANDSQGPTFENGTLENGASFGPGRTGQGFVLDGIDDRVQLGNPTNLQLQDFSIEMWIKRSSSTIVTNNPAAGFNGGTFLAYGSNGYGFAIDEPTNRLVLTKIGVSAVSAPSLSITDTNFHHVAVTKSGNQVIFYVDGVATAPVTYDAVFAFTTNIAIGTRGDADVRNAFFGTIDDLGVYNRSLSPAEINTIANGGMSQRTPFDFDCDGRADLSVFRAMADPAVFDFAIRKSSDNGLLGYSWGLPGDLLAPGDYDGDGITDVAVYRQSESRFYIRRSSDGGVTQDVFGITGDILTVGDWDGDSKDDVSVYREGTQSVFFFRASSNNPNRNITFVPFGTTGDRPVRGDFDGDGKFDTAVFRPSNGTWYIRQSSNNQLRFVQFGLAMDKAVASDYDGDGQTDIAVYRNGTWIILQSGSNQVRYQTFGLASDRLVPADYDGDRKTDLAVYRDGMWIILNSASGVINFRSFGASGDTPIPNAYMNQ